MEEILFGGTPRIPTTQEFEDAQKNNPLWAKLIQKAQENFLDEDPERKKIYGDPEKGATLEQAWMSRTLLGDIPYCLLSTDQKPVSTSVIKRVIKFSSKQLINTLIPYLASTDYPKSIQTFYFDGKIGHCINLIAFDKTTNRILYSDPWPLNSLLAEENNDAGIKAQHVIGQRWCITTDELQKVIFACFISPSEWLKLQNEAYAWKFSDWQNGSFYKFFNLSETGREKDIYEINHAEFYRISLETGGFKNFITIEMETSIQEEITKGTLILHRLWIKNYLHFALDIFKSFIGSFCPFPEIEYYEDLTRKIWQYNDSNNFKKLINRKSTEEVDNSDNLMLTFLGENEKFSIPMDFSIITTENISYKEIEFFRLEIIIK